MRKARSKAVRCELYSEGNFTQTAIEVGDRVYKCSAAVKDVTAFRYPQTSDQSDEAVRPVLGIIAIDAKKLGRQFMIAQLLFHKGDD
jgi:hypothetical protein